MWVLAVFLLWAAAAKRQVVLPAPVALHEVQALQVASTGVILPGGDVTGPFLEADAAQVPSQVPLIPHARTPFGEEVAPGFRGLGSRGIDDWGPFLGFVVVLLLLDHFLVSRLQGDTFASALLVSIIFVALGLSFVAFVFAHSGKKDGMRWIDGFLLEYMLSMDNLFVFTAVFTVFRTPKHLIRGPLNLGLLVAVALRLVFFALFGELLAYVRPVQVFLGVVLIFSAGQTLMSTEGDESEGVADVWVVRLFRKFAHVSEAYDEDGSYFASAPLNGDQPPAMLRVTPLFLTVITIVCVDVLFAVDSVTAKVVGIPDAYLAYTSTVMAMFGLRSMYFVVSHVVDMFIFMNYGLALVLAYLGFQILFPLQLHMSQPHLCASLLMVLTTCAVSSVAYSKYVKGEQPQAEEPA
mmetsp:Transcript_10428/g.22892  ORF Transcript_10428/g.22892 Transcript_10428/m.22892 type:complete len:408 (+) Transcript_10428:21-1244(+)